MNLNIIMNEILELLRKVRLSLYGLKNSCMECVFGSFLKLDRCGHFELHKNLRLKKI